MRFWDSSALVPLLVGETRTTDMLAELEQDPEIVAWWGSGVECVSALARLEREGQLAAADVGTALTRLAGLEAAWHEVQPVDVVRRAAVRLLRVHSLRAADALQLAAAIVAANGRPENLTIVTLDDRLAAAADREGFPIGPAEHRTGTGGLAAP